MRSTARRRRRWPTLARCPTLWRAVSRELRADACSSLFYVATSPTEAPIRRTRWRRSRPSSVYPWHKPDKIFELLNYFYPLPKLEPGKLLRPIAVPALSDVRSQRLDLPAQVHRRRLSGGGKLMIDSEGNAWVADNFTVGAQNQDASWTGGLTKFAPNGKPLSPSPLGFRGGGIAGPGFGLTLDAQDNAWPTSFTGQNITKFDKNGKPLSPPEGWNFNRQISQMQGIIATPSGDIWALDLLKGQIVKLPAGRSVQGPVLLSEQDGRSAEEPL